MRYCDALCGGGQVPQATPAKEPAAQDATPGDAAVGRPTVTAFDVTAVEQPNRFCARI
jgi:hypothetical protein